MSEIKSIAKKTFFETAIAAAEELPFMAAAKAAMVGAYQARLTKQFNDFIHEVAKPLAFGNVEQACQRIAEDMEEPWMAAGLEEGWRKSLDAMDPLAKRCIYQMVVDYLTQKKEPDRFHRQFANLFVECDQEILKVLQVVADHLATNEWRVAQMLEVADSKGPDRAPREFHLVLGNESFIRLDDAALFAGEILVRNRFGKTIEGYASLHPEQEKYHASQYLCLVASHKAPLWKKLRDYLEPVRQANAATP